jgi:hypothetical protein
MAAAADRFAGDVLERVSPELVLVDTALAEEMRRRLRVPDDTLARIARGIEPRMSVHVAEVDIDGETEAEENALAAGELAPMLASAVAVEHHDLGIEDLIVLPDEDPPSVPPTLLVVPDEGITQLVPEPDEIVTARVSGIEDSTVVPAEDRAQPQSKRRTYPALPSPSSDADEEDATDVVLRVIRDHIEHETPPKRRRRWLLSFASLFAAFSSIAILAVQLRLGVYELPHWLPS